MGCEHVWRPMGCEHAWGVCVCVAAYVVAAAAATRSEAAAARSRQRQRCGALGRAARMRRAAMRRGGGEPTQPARTRLESMQLSACSCVHVGATGE